MLLSGWLAACSCRGRGGWSFGVVGNARSIWFIGDAQSIGLIGSAGYWWCKLHKSRVEGRIKHGFLDSEN